MASGGTVDDVVAALDAAVAIHDWRTVQGTLAAASADELARAAEWYAAGGRVAAAENASEFNNWPPQPVSNDPSAVVQLLAVFIAPSAALAAKWFGWRSWGWTGSVEAEAAVLAALAGRGVTWCEAFATASARIQPARQVLGAPGRYFQVLAPLADHFGFDLPRPDWYGLAWASYFSFLVPGGREFRRRRDPGDEDSPIRVDQVWIDADGSMRVDGREIIDVALEDLLRADPGLQDSLAAAILQPGVLSLFRQIEPWDFVETVVSLTTDGALERQRVIDDTLTALTGQESQSIQRLLARVIAELGVTAADLEGRVPLLQTVMGIARGEVTAQLLSTVFDTLGAGDDLVELAATVFGRTEKKQQRDLLAKLTEPGTHSRFGEAAVVASLELALQTDDLAVKQRATVALEPFCPGIGAKMADPSTSALWDRKPDGVAVTRLEAITPTVASLTRQFEDASSRVGFTGYDREAVYDNARMLATLVGTARRDPDGLRSWLAEAPVYTLQDLRPEWVAALWRHEQFTQANYADFVNEVAASHPVGGYLSWDRSIDVDIWTMSNEVTLAQLLYRETALRFGEIQVLLSTPSLSNGVVTWDDLLARLPVLAEDGYGPNDLMQLLLRLEPVDPARAVDLGDLRMPPMPGRADLSDGVDAIRRWVEAGGARYPNGVDAGGKLAVGPLELPIDPALLRDLPAALFAGLDPEDARMRWPHRETIENTIGVFPHWPELIAAQLSPFAAESKYVATLVPAIAAAPNAGLATHTIIVQTLVHHETASRVFGVQAILDALVAGTFDADTFVAACIRLHRLGQLSPARLAGSLEQLLLGGGTSLWGSIVVLAGVIAGSDSVPAGTADLLGVVRRFITDAPPTSIPESIRALAARKGSSKAQIEARAIVLTALAA